MSSFTPDSSLNSAAPSPSFANQDQHNNNNNTIDNNSINNNSNNSGNPAMSAQRPSVSQIADIDIKFL